MDAAAATPPPRGLAKLRKLASASTHSLVRSSGEDDNATGDAAESEQGRRRGSLDKAKSVDERSGSEDLTGRLSALISKTKQKVRRSDRAHNDSERSQSIDSEPAGLPASHSETSLFLHESGRSSLLTDDDKIDSDGKPIRPSLSPRDSHAGYLTLSSPDINAQTSPLIPGAAIVSSPEDTVPPADLLTNIPHIVEPDTGPQDPAASEPTSSPVAKLRGSFSLSRKKSSGDDSVKSTSGGGGGGGSGGLSGLFKASSRTNSVSSQSAAGSLEVDKTRAVPTPKGELRTTTGQAWSKSPKPRGRQSKAKNLSIPANPPNLLEPPTTLITPPTPTDSTSNAPQASSPTSPQKSSPARSLNSVESIKHRRSQSANFPSKLSASITSPLTPTVEETKTPGGTLTQPHQASASTGFFSSFFSVAQKAGAQLSSSVNSPGPPNQKKPGSTVTGSTEGGEEVIPGVESRPGTGFEAGKTKELAVETIGTGNLSLSHLGIPDSEDTSLMSSTADLARGGTQISNGDQDRKAEEEAAARAVSSAYDKPMSSTAGQATPGRPVSIASSDRLASNGDQTPPRAPMHREPNDIKRSGSVRSKLSGRRKHRGSSATAGTGNSIAAALKDSTLGLVNPTLHGQGHRLTGFAVASSKRNKDFHQLFRSVPEDDYLIEDYSAALQRDILLHGRLYVSEGHICFSSNILGWVTNLVISFDEVVAVEKKSTAVIFPNAIVISTLHARNTFASFVARDSTYELLIGIWKISHPNLKSSLNGVTLDDSGTGDKTEVAEQEDSENDTEATEDEVYDEDEDDDAGSFTDGGLAASVAGSEVDTALSRKASAAPVSSAPQANGTNGATSKGLEGADAVVTGAAVSSDHPGLPGHDPTSCTDASEHYDKQLTDTTIPAPLGKVYSLMFGPASGAFMRKWLVEDEKSENLNYVDDKTGLDNDHTTFTFDYIKPLSAPLGPKQTKCITTNTLKTFDLEKAVSIDCSTQTPDVPSGNVFVTKTRYCLMWGPANSTRLLASCTVEWSGKSWLRGPIEKGAEAGQIEYVTHIIAALKAAVTTKPPVRGIARKGKRKGKKEVFDAEEANTQRVAAIAVEKKPSAWGPLETVQQTLDPVVTLLRPLISSQVVIAVLLLLLAYSWFSRPHGSKNLGSSDYTSPARIAAYEEIWRREESALWDWLEDRVGLDEGYATTLGIGKQQHDERQKKLHARNMGKKLEDARMSERQMDERIRTTEEKLAALKEAVERRKPAIHR